MRHVRDAELDARIHKFLYRKFTEFPELARGGKRPASGWIRGRVIRYYYPRNHWNTETYKLTT